MAGLGAKVTVVSGRKGVERLEGGWCRGDEARGLNRCDQMICVCTGFDDSSSAMPGIFLVAGAQQTKAFEQICITSDSARVAAQVDGAAHKGVVARKLDSFNVTHVVPMMIHGCIDRDGAYVSPGRKAPGWLIAATGGQIPV